MKNNFDKGLVFKRFDVRGKAFIEYIPAENAWCPITADNYIFINCFGYLENLRVKDILIYCYKSVLMIQNQKVNMD